MQDVNNDHLKSVVKKLTNVIVGSVLLEPVFGVRVSPLPKLGKRKVDTTIPTLL